MGAVGHPRGPRGLGQWLVPVLVAEHRGRLGALKAWGQWLPGLWLEVAFLSARWSGHAQEGGVAPLLVPGGRVSRGQRGTVRLALAAPAAPVPRAVLGRRRRSGCLRGGGRWKPLCAP